MKTQTAPIGPKDALCTLFVMIRDSGRPSMAQLAARLGARPVQLECVVRSLRKQGLVQDDVLSLTFLGLATAASLLPTHRIHADTQHFIAAA